MEPYNLYQQAKALGACARLRGNESPEQLMRLLKTPQGTEFCTKHNFPDMEIFHQVDSKMASRNGIYIDIRVELSNIQQVILVGKGTHARLRYDDPTVSYQVVLMHGATAEIEASSWAVVFVYGDGAVCNVTDNARIL